MIVSCDDRNVGMKINNSFALIFALVEVGFTESEIALLSDGHNSVCVEIFGIATEDIMPGLNIDLNLTVSPASTHGGM